MKLLFTFKKKDPFPVKFEEVPVNNWFMVGNKTFIRTRDRKSVNSTHFQGVISNAHCFNDHKASLFNWGDLVFDLGKPVVENHV